MKKKPMPRLRETSECPQPSKRKFDRKRDAKKHLSRTSVAREELKVYLCRCGYFHVGHKPGSGFRLAKKMGRLGDPTFDPREYR